LLLLFAKKEQAVSVGIRLAHDAGGDCVVWLLLLLCVVMGVHF
jgi:hypothetical protein